MKKYTNKILIAAIVLFLAACTIHYFVTVSEIKKQIEQYDEANESITNE